ncbi:hypothetical protein OIU79_005417 [Salix purpurea]|uniref:BED-type domain-containing protein n=1 Tax=Salix purpurea TaxID=77065 RepID=A0A9Q0ZAU2_SALPP|nr:hypothetical protein OIU79_005417 [Salix purpurea]
MKERFTPFTLPFSKKGVTFLAFPLSHSADTFPIHKSLGLSRSGSDTRNCRVSSHFFGPTNPAFRLLTIPSQISTVLQVESFSQQFSRMQFKDHNHNLAPPRATDPGWAHGTMVNGGRQKIKCKYCHKIFLGGGISRLKQHLAGERGNVTPCEEVPEDVKVQIQQHLGFKVLEKLRKQKEENSAKNLYLSYFQDKEGDDEDNDDAGPLQKMAIRRRGKEVVEGTSKRTKRRKKQHPPMAVPVVARPLLQNIASQESFDQADSAVARFMYEAGVPLSAANSYTFQQMADSIAAVGPGYKMPSYNALRGRLLNRSVQDAGEYCKETEKVLGNITKSAEGLCNLFDSVVQEVGPKIIVNFVTDTSPAYKAAGKLLADKYKTFFCSTCGVQCIDLMLEEISKKDESPLTKQREGIEVAEILVDQLFWSMCDHALNAAKPLLSVLHLMDREDRPSVGYVYDAMEKAKKSIIEAFDNMESDYASYLKIIDHVWQEEFHSPLHAAACHLNPAVFYNANFSFNKVIQKGLLDCIETIEPSLSAQVTITSHIKFYEEAVGDFGRPVALHGRESLAPATWWSLYAADYPDLQRLAVRILSQTCSITTSERSWSMFECIQYKKRNRLEQHRLSDLTFVHHNLFLKERRAEATKSRCMRNNIDPTCLEAMDASMGDWVEDLEEDLSWLDETVTTEQENHGIQNTDDSNSNESTDDRSSDLTKGLDGDDDL